MSRRRIVWISRHAPTKSQLAELGRLFPAYDLHFDPAPFSGAADIVARFHAQGGDEMVVVAPWGVMRAIIRHGIRPIWAEMEEVDCKKPHEVVMGGAKKRCYRFAKFHRCKGVKLELEEITPQGESK